MFDDTKPRKCVIIGAFNVHTSVFWGNRLEIYIIARHKKTGLTSWLIQEYETNTISYDPGRGFIPPDTKNAILTTSFLGELILDVEGLTTKNKIEAYASIRKGEWRALNQDLWIDGNLSVDYGSSLNDYKSKPFGLVFDPEEMKEALYLSPEECEVRVNTFLQGIIAKTPFEVCCFPFAQHFHTTTMPLEHAIKTREDLERRVLEINGSDTDASKAPTKGTHESACSAYCYNYACKDGCRLKQKE